MQKGREFLGPCSTIIVETIPSFRILCMLVHFVRNTNCLLKEQTTLVWDPRTVFDLFMAFSSVGVVTAKIIQHSLQSSETLPHRFPSNGPRTYKEKAKGDQRVGQNGQMSHSFKDGIPSWTKQEVLREYITITASNTSHVCLSGIVMGFRPGLSRIFGTSVPPEVTFLLLTVIME